MQRKQKSFNIRPIIYHKIAIQTTIDKTDFTFELKGRLTVLIKKELSDKIALFIA